MSARDIIHEPVKKALENDGWTVTDDPLIIRLGGRTARADLGAERTIGTDGLIGAIRDQEMIAVEIKSFLQNSALAEFEKALGQYLVYEIFLKETHSKRQVYLAVSEFVYTTLFQEPAFQVLLNHHRLRLIIVNLGMKKVVKWIE
ncbi:MAG: XisH family protein [Chloroflexota bacterium]